MQGKPEFATILAFDVRVDAEAQAFAEENHVRIFTAEIIYHLERDFKAYMSGIIDARKAEATLHAVFPCILKILPQHVYNKKDPLVFGVEVLDGTLKLNTPLCVPSKLREVPAGEEGWDGVVGRVIGIQNNSRDVDTAKKGSSVSIKVSNPQFANITYGRQFDHTDTLYSRISRKSIDALKEFFKE